MTVLVARSAVGLETAPNNRADVTVGGQYTSLLLLTRHEGWEGLRLECRCRRAQQCCRWQLILMLGGWSQLDG